VLAIVGQQARAALGGHYQQEIDLAFEWLERAYVQRDGGLTETKTDRLFRRLHADPRWGVFLRKIGLPE